MNFLPGSEDRYLVSGAMDGTVQLHILTEAPMTGSSGKNVGVGGGGRGVGGASCLTKVFQCHEGRVKVKGWCKRELN